MNLIRAVAKPYPGAFTFLEGIKIYIWKVRLPRSSVKGAPGLIIGFEQGSPIVCCGKGGLVLDDFEFHDNNIHPIKIGNKFASRVLAQ
jgi:methionyl-tRNA formyltransferase